MGYEFSEMKVMKDKLVDLLKESHKIHMRIANRIGLMAVRKVKKMTPVDTGDLRNNWKHYVFKRGDTFFIVVYNQVEYASFVEKGHRIVVAGQTVGWVEGKFMLKLTMDEMERIAPRMWQREVEKEMRGLF
ncbi:HK97 gp10 family phage protein [Mesobacillus stamsii]|uniref:HK97 gp10 family phage protein n=1 Tax=Mesobacillus stamsii TaxID=225347 RepID=A0ABU0FTS8_9BACI|nr:HK97 gp10 family phage protein [Mesobacillus stamsii]MDQ0412722.1 hypothetical protein [Mesobacillus stamsii]